MREVTKSQRGMRAILNLKDKNAVAKITFQKLISWNLFRKLTIYGENVNN